MKPLGKLALYVALAAGGYAAGIGLPWGTGASDLARESAAISATRAGEARGAGTAPTGATKHRDGPARDPRTGATFAESRERLGELAQRTHQVGKTLILGENQRIGMAELEIERIFALATREEILGFFADFEHEETEPNDALLSAAYGRLAAFSLDDAMAIWTEQLQGTGKGTGVEGLVAAWSREDALAAEQWVDGIADRGIRESALIALLEEVVETSPEIALRRITEVGRSGEHSSLFASIGLANRLGQHLALSELASQADRFLAEESRGWRYQNQLQALLEAWGERDSAAMMAWLLAQPPGRLQDHVQSRLAKARTEIDPAAFVTALGPAVADNASVAQLAGQSWLEWMRRGEGKEEALEWFRTHGDDLEIPYIATHYLQSWSVEDMRTVLDRFAEFPDDTQIQPFALTLLHKLSEQDPESALSYAAEHLPSGEKTKWFISSALMDLAHATRKNEPEAALRWALEEAEAGPMQTHAIRSVMSTWAESAPRKALEQVIQLPETLREEAYESIANRWADKAPKQFLDYLQSPAGRDASPAMAEALFYRFGNKGQGEARLADAMKLPSEAMREQATRSLFRGWAHSNLESSAHALNRMEEGPLRDGAISEFVSVAGWNDREAAMTWSLEIADTKMRRSNALEQGRRWLKADRESATQWIQSHENLPAEWKAELLKPKGK